MSSYVKTTSPAGSLNKQRGRGGGFTKGCLLGCFFFFYVFSCSPYDCVILGRNCLNQHLLSSDLTRLLHLRADRAVSVPSGEAGTFAHSFFFSLLFIFFLPGRKHYLISFSGCSVLEQGDNGRLEIHVSDSHTRPQLNPFISSPPPPPPLVCPPPPPLFPSPPKISITHPHPHPVCCARERGASEPRWRRGGGGDFSHPEPNNLISTAPTRTHLPPPPPGSRAATVSVVYFI